MYRTIDCGMWRDAWFSELPPSAKLLFVYLMTNPLTSQAGALETTIRAMAFDTGIDPADVEAILASFGDRVVWWPGHHVVWLRNFVRRQKIEQSPRLLVSARRAVADLHQEIRAVITKQYPSLSPGVDTLPIPYANGTDTSRALSRTEQSRTVLEQSSSTTTGPAAANGADDGLAAAPPAAKNRGKACCYEETLSNGAMSKLVTLFGSVHPQFTEGWVRMTLRENQDVGPLPRDKLGQALTLAIDQLRRDVESGWANNPRALGKKTVRKYLEEQASASP
jgi:hypothetical protein